MHIDHILVARILFTVMTAGWAILTVVADFNKTHATNPAWTPHARFHVVWQISSYVGFGLLAFGLIWWPGPLAVERLYLVALMGAIVYTAFFAALIAMPIYGGAAYDTNGYRPFKAPIPIIATKWDANITAFSVQLVILLAGLLAAESSLAKCRLRWRAKKPARPRASRKISLDEYFLTPLADHRQGRNHKQSDSNRDQAG